MAKENVIDLKNINAHIMFTIVSEDGQSEEESMIVNNSEEIENTMRLFFEEKWEELFGDQYDHERFSYAYFNGIAFINDGADRVTMQIYGPYKQGSCSLDLKTLADKNADKVKRILEIAAE